jgi:hypothetical protein
LTPRVVFSRGFDFWESGMDLHPSEDMYESFRKYQTSLLAQFDRLAEDYGFEVIDATVDIQSIFSRLQVGIRRILETGAIKPKPTEFVRQTELPVSESRPAEQTAQMEKVEASTEHAAD